MRPNALPTHWRHRPLLALWLLTGLLAAVPSGFAAETRNIQLRETPVRASPGPFAETLGKLRYGASVVVVERGDGWTRVRSREGGLTGWLRSSALTERDIALQAGEQDAQVEASDDEIATAAKGFNERVEEKYKEEKDVDYTWVDRMERFEVADDARARFLQRGNLDVP